MERVRSVVCQLVRVLVCGAAISASPVSAQVIVSTPITAGPGIGPGSPYPLNIPISGLAGVPTDVKVRLRGVTHTSPTDFDILLVAPNGWKTMLMSDPEVVAAMSGVDLTFANGAPALPTTIVSGTYAPSNRFPGDSLPAPAPAAPSTTIMPNSTTANGTWQLFVADDAGGDAGSIAGVDLFFTLTNYTFGGIAANTTTDIPVAMTGLRGSVVKVTGDLILEHYDTSLLDISLIAPDGTAIELSTGNGTGPNYGGCPFFDPTCMMSPPAITTFDDSASLGITEGSNPFKGTYRPEQPLNTFAGKAGTAANGTWIVRVLNRAPSATGSLSSFVLKLQDGGPLAAADSYTTAFGTPITVVASGVLSNDDPRGSGPLSATVASAAAHGVVALAANGSFTYTPNPGFVGTDTFSYRPFNSLGPGPVTAVSIAVQNATTVQPPISLRAAIVSGNVVTLRWNPSPIGPAPVGYLFEGGVTPGQVLATIPVGTTPILSLTAPNRLVPCARARRGRHHERPVERAADSRQRAGAAFGAGFPDEHRERLHAHPRLAQHLRRRAGGGVAASRLVLGPWFDHSLGVPGRRRRRCRRPVPPGPAPRLRPIDDRARAARRNARCRSPAPAPGCSR